MRFNIRVWALALVLFFDAGVTMTGAQEPSRRQTWTTAQGIYVTPRLAEPRSVDAGPLVRSSRYLVRVQEIFREEGVPAEFVWIAHVESGWRVRARSRHGAVGLWQLMPDTARSFGVRAGDRTNVERSTRATARYLKYLLQRYDGDRLLALAAFNCGEGRLDRAISRGRTRDFWALCTAGLLPRETVAYVPAVLDAADRACVREEGR